MAWAKLQHERREVDTAGRTLGKLTFPVVSSEGLSALAIINNWRASHAYPLNTFQLTLRRKARKIERDAIVAQRAKRLESIHAKLARQPSMRMSQMQDIAGCRAVMSDMASVRTLVQNYRISSFGHKLKGEKDYITNPKKDGYRCHHLVFQYKGTEWTKVYDGLQVEVQIRTQLQHAWATAVEAVGIFTAQALKSNKGSVEWLRFFSLMSSAIASMERCPPVPETPETKEALIAELRGLVEKLRVLNLLKAYSATIDLIGSAKDAKYFLMSLQPETARMNIWQFKAKESELANAKYTELEGTLPEGSSTQIVLVSADNINALKRAYPNYFLDTNVFGNVVTKVLKGQFPKPLPPQTIPVAA